jgi:type IV pilus assembly protein PilQ
VTTTKGLALILTAAVAGFFAESGGSASGGATAVVQLKSISARQAGKNSSLIIETSDPAGYVTTQPDPLTLYVDFRNVGAEGLVNRFEPSSKSPVTAVAVEATEALGAPVSRVRITLAQSVPHHVRSDRNAIIVDFEPVAASGAALSAPARRPVDAIAALEQMSAASSVSNSASVAAAGPKPASASPALASATPVSLKPSPAAPAGSPVAAPQAPGVVPPAGPQGAERRFTGNPVSLDFQGADLRAVLRTFSEISGLNIVIDPKVQGTVDVALRDVPWDQALDIILRANTLGYTVEGTIVRIAPLDSLEAEERKRGDLAKAQVETARISTLTRQLSYAKGEDVVTLLKASVLSNRGQAIVDARTNTLIITDLAEKLTSAADLIGAIDKAQPQVEIEARIVQTNKSFARQLGVQWGFGGYVDPALGNTTNLAFPNRGSLTGRAGPSQGPSGAIGGNTPGQVATAVNLPAAGATSGIGLALGSINGAFNLDVALSALETTGKGRVLSTPRVTTQNNVEAEMTQGTQIPIQTLSNNTVTVQFKDAALVLKVTPQITASQTVIMKIALENGQADFTRSVNNIPPINTQRANTTVLVSDGQTTVIGGIYLSSEQTQTDRTPGLGTLPVIKWLFKHDRIDDSSSELLIFITPRIIKT